MPIISIASHCGGVGRTTTVANISPAFAELGYRVLAIDFSSQPNLINHIGVLENYSRGKTIDKVLRKQLNIKTAIVKTRFGFDFLGCSWFLGFDNIINQNEDRNILKEALESIKEYYDYIFIDLPSRPSFIDDCGLVASDFILIPISSSDTSKIGLESILYSINTIKQKFRSNISILGCFVSQKNSLTRIDKRLIKDSIDCAIENQIEVIEPYISKSVIFLEEGLYGVPATVLHRKHKVINAYMDLARNIVTRLNTMEMVL